MSAREVLSAAGDTRLLAAARLRTLRGTSTRVMAGLGVFAVCLGVIIASNAGALIMALATDRSEDSFVREGAQGILLLVARGDLAVMVTIVLVVAGIAATAIPLATGTPATLVSPEHRMWLPVHPMSKYFESALMGSLSLVTFAQLIVLTALASLASLEGAGRPVALGVAWLTWVALAVISNAFMWIAAYARQARRAGYRPSRGGVLVSVSAVALAGVWAAVHRERARTLGGLSDVYVSALRGELPVAFSVVCGAAVVAGVGYVGWLAAARVPDAWSARSARRQVHAREIRGGAFTVLAVALCRSAARMPSVRNQVVTVLVLLTAVTAVTGPGDRAVWGISLGVPLVVSLAFTRNFLAVLGPGNLWLGSLRTGMSHLPLAGATVAFVACLGGVGVVWTVPAIMGRMDASDVAAVTLASVATSALMTATSVLYAVRRPRPRAGAEEALLGAGVTITSTLRLAVVPGLGSWAATSGVLAAGRGYAVAAWLTLVCLAVAVLVLFIANAHWVRPARRSDSLVGAL